MTPPAWFKGDLTTWAIHVSTTNWNFIECRRILSGVEGAS